MTVSTIPARTGIFTNPAPRMTYAQAVALTSVPTGYEVFATDWGANGTRVFWSGTRWLPVGGRVLLKHLGSQVTGVANSETIVLSGSAPVGAIQAGDGIDVDVLSMTKSGATDTGNFTVRMGTAGTTADTSLVASTVVMAAANLGSSVRQVFKVVDNTHVQRTRNVNSFYTPQENAAFPAAVVVSDLSANAVFVSFGILSSATNDTVAIREGYIWQIVN